MEPTDREELFGNDEPKRSNTSYSLLHAWMYGEITDEQYDKYKKEPREEFLKKGTNAV